MIQGIVDIGSNTIRLNVYFYKNKKFKLLFSKKEKLGLAMYVKNGNLSKEGIEKTILTLKALKKDLKCLKIENFRFFATASLRNIKNTAEVIKIIEKKVKINIHLLSGEKEGELSFIGAKESLQKEKGILVDIGGGSTEIVFFDKKKVKTSYSLPIGPLKIYKNYVSNIFPNKSEKILIEERVIYELDKLNLKKSKIWQKSKKKKKNIICGVGGTFRALKETIPSLNVEEEKKFISPKSLENLEKKLKESDGNTFKKILMINPSRIHTLIPGILMIKIILSYFNCSKIQVSEFGIREGYLQDKIMRDELNEKIE